MTLVLFRIQVPYRHEYQVFQILQTRYNLYTVQFQSFLLPADRILLQVRQVSFLRQFFGTAEQPRLLFYPPLFHRMY